MAALGMTLEDYADELACDVWPDNWEAIKVFMDLGTQWREGMNGRTGLDYSAIQNVFRLRGVPRSKWNELFDCIQVMESAALTEIRSDK